MRITSTSDGVLHAEISLRELLVMNNALNEVCNGLPRRDFENRIGATLAEVERLLGDVSKVIDSQQRH